MERKIEVLIRRIRMARDLWAAEPICAPGENFRYGFGTSNKPPSEGGPPLIQAGQVLEVCYSGTASIYEFRKDGHSYSVNLYEGEYEPLSERRSALRFSDRGVLLDDLYIEAVA